MTIDHYGVDVTVSFVPGVGWHWRVLTVNEDWSACADSLEDAQRQAFIRLKKVMVGLP